MVPPAAPEKAPTVAVVTVSFGSGGVLPKFIESITAASAQPLLTIVADNKPDGDELVQRQAEEHGARYLALRSNRGYGGAVNAATADLPASVRWILVSNPDVVLSANAIDILVAAGEENEKIAAVGPCIRGAGGELYPSARAVPSMRTGIGHALFVNLWSANPWTRAYRKETEEQPHRRDAGWLSGACVMVRRSAFEQLGGFDEGFFMYFEDVDLGYRFGKAGWDNLYVPRASVTHTGAHSTRSDPAPMLRAHHQSARHYLNRRYPAPILTPLRLVLGLALIVREQILVARERRERRR